MAETGMNAYHTYSLPIERQFTSQQERSPFYLMYGQDARLPTKTVLSQRTTPYQVDIWDYRTELVTPLSDAWNLAQGNIAIVQAKQKRNYDRGSKELKLQKGDRVVVLWYGCQER